MSSKHRIFCSVKFFVSTTKLAKMPNIRTVLIVWGFSRKRKLYVGVLKSRLVLARVVHCGTAEYFKINLLCIYQPWQRAFIVKDSLCLKNIRWSWCLGLLNSLSYTTSYPVVRVSSCKTTQNGRSALVSRFSCCTIRLLSAHTTNRAPRPTK